MDAKLSSVLAFETRLKQETYLRLAMDTSLASLNTRFSEAFFSRVDNGVFACFTALFLCVLRFLPVDLWPRPWPLGGGVVNPDAIPDGRLRSIDRAASLLSLSCSFQVPAFLGREFQIGREISRLLSLVSLVSLHPNQTAVYSPCYHQVIAFSLSTQIDPKVAPLFHLATWNNKRVHAHLSTTIM